MKTENSVIIEEQGLRDGIQNLTQLLSIEQKIHFIDQLVDAGIKRIQIASFVHPKLVPQMADAEKLCKLVDKKDGVLYSGLVLNLKGVERAINAGLEHVSCSISASDTHSQKNARKTHTEAKAAFVEMVKLCKENNLIARGGIQCAFGCRYEGMISKRLVLDMVKSHLDTGIDELALADSTGMANPRQIEELMNEVLEQAGNTPVILHLHNTESKGYANVYAALRSGVRIFDAAFGGLGGCPFIKSATGNIATEDTIHMLHQMGYETGIDINKVAKLSQEMEAFLGHGLQSKMYSLLQKDDIAII